MDYLSTISPFSIYDFTAGADEASPLPDVSWSSPDMQTSTPTGNGSGVFVDTGWQNAILGGITSAVNYAITRDQQQMSGQIAAGTTATAQVLAQRKQANTMFLLLAGVGLFLVLK